MYVAYRVFTDDLISMFEIVMFEMCLMFNLLPVNA